MTKRITDVCQGCGKRFRKAEMALFSKSQEEIEQEALMYGEATTGVPYKVKPNYYLCRDCYPSDDLPATSEPELEPEPEDEADFVCINSACPRSTITDETVEHHSGTGTFHCPNCGERVLSIYEFRELQKPKFIHCCACGASQLDASEWFELPRTSGPRHQQTGEYLESAHVCPECAEDIYQQVAECKVEEAVRREAERQSASSYDEEADVDTRDYESEYLAVKETRSDLGTP